MEGRLRRRKEGSPGGKPEKRERRRFGANVEIHNYWVRHAQKQSGEMANASGSGLSSSSISERGRQDSVELGQAMSAAPDGAKSYVSTSDRTHETAAAILAGYQASNPDAPIRNMRIREKLSADGIPDDYMRKYSAMFAASRDALMVQEGYEGVAFSSLSPDEQQRIAETAEEPVVREWLDNPNSELAQLFPPEQAARAFAEMFAVHNIRMPKKLYTDSSVDLIHVSHKTVAEAFLVSGVLVRAEDGEVMRSLKDLGGSVDILESWESIARTDDQGELSVTVLVRGTEYRLDKERFNELISKE